MSHRRAGRGGARHRGSRRELNPLSSGVPAITTPPPHTAGHTDARFAAVRDAFVSNFEREDEIGAAVCIHVDGVRVVDLWGGWADREERIPWQADTLVNAYSVGKGILAILVAALVEAGKLAYEERVADRWPAFASHDKGGVTLAELLSHRAGLPAVREPLPAGSMLDWKRMCDALASQAPYWTPGTRHGYHVGTFGFLVGEMVRRAMGRGVGDVLRETLADRLDADYYWGVPVALHPRIAHVYAPRADEGMASQDVAIVAPPSGDAAQDQMMRNTYFNPPGFSGLGYVNRSEWRAAAIPSTNGHGTARSVALFYDAVLHGKVASQAVLDEATRIHSDGEDAILRRPSRFGLGFQLPQESRPIGANDGTFGHYGYGGSLGYADPEAGIAFGYVMNRPGERWQIPRLQKLVDALYDSLS